MSMLFEASQRHVLLLPLAQFCDTATLVSLLKTRLGQDCSFDLWKAHLDTLRPAFLCDKSPPAGVVPSSNGNLPTAGCRRPSGSRILAEYLSWTYFPINGFRVRLFDSKGPDPLGRWICTVPGMMGTHLQGTSFDILMEFPETYPWSPPNCTLQNGYHPNIYPSGRICDEMLMLADALETPRPSYFWSCNITTRDILLHIEQFLVYGCLASPSYAEPYSFLTEITPQTPQQIPSEEKLNEYAARLRQCGTAWVSSENLPFGFKSIPVNERIICNSVDEFKTAMTAQPGRLDRALITPYACVFGTGRGRLICDH